MAKRAETSHSHRIYEEREEKLVSSKDGKQFKRVARFLKPCAPNSSKAVGPSNTPLLSDVFPHSLQQWPSTVVFPGSKKPQKKWVEWIDRLAGKYCTIWNQAGICDAIMSSKYETNFNKDLVLVLAEFWCSETNTFLFDWGEATITMEDVMVLGGFSVLGKQVTRPINGVLMETVEEMEKKKTELTRTPARKAYHLNWMTHFMKLQDYKHEHVAFLSLWLARFVFPSLPEDSLGKHVFPIAVLLSQGTRVALAPAVLAGLFRDLSFLENQAIKGEEMISVWSPFQLLQLWALERFQGVLKSPPKRLNPGEPRAARWNKVNIKISLPDVRREVNLAKNFRWRPYTAELTNWLHGSYYQAKELCCYDKTTDQNLQSYVKCLCCAKLVGVEDCKEKYLPHRVAMQFGIDQDLPGDPVERSGLDCNSGTTDVRFFLPGRFFGPSVTARYSYWWGIYKSDRADAIKDDVKVAEKKIKEKSTHHHSMEEKNLKAHKASRKALSKCELEKNHFCAVPKVPRKSNCAVRTQPSATAQFPKKVKKDLSLNHRGGGDIPLLKQRGLVEKRPACLRNASTTRKSTKYVSSQSRNPNENMKKRKLATPTEEFPAKKRNTSEYGKNLWRVATKGTKDSDIANVQSNVRITQEQQVRAKVSDKGSAKGGEKAMADGSLKKPMGVDGHKVKQSERCAAKGGKKAMAERTLKKPMEADGHKVKQSKRGAVKEVKRTMENARTRPQKDGLLMRVQNLEKIVGI
ncbi:putative protein-serine/threonine phosphatase [Rosa chinensis]|uniref:Aminotransferase-like plant mobile domain-containing protein n=1 Tax=Rosa chinensis TaxID=74649 RepID=A0A2P6QBZ1_ROSCH|nr:uncharacterized protein LOC112203658 [Rosa chinensis]PRQ31697.1 putative protein-serine/threonine phosphatase [Rosa chinensis]